MALTDKLTAVANAIRAKTGGTAAMTLAEMPTEIASIQTGITPSGSVTLTEENTYDVTDKAQAIVDFSTTRANLAEAVTAKGVDTLPTSSFDTIATNIGLISGGGGGYVKAASGTVELTADTQNLQIETNYTGTPKIIHIFASDGLNPSATRVFELARFLDFDFDFDNNAAISIYQNTNGSKGAGNQATITFSSGKITCTRINSSMIYRSGSTYTWEIYE